MRAEELFDLDDVALLGGGLARINDGEAIFVIRAAGLDEDLAIHATDDDLCDAYAAWCRVWIQETDDETP